MANFRGLHVVAGVAAMMVAAMLGSAMKLNNTAVVMSSCVVFVAVAMWVDGALSKRRRESLTLQQAASLEQATSLEPAVSSDPSALLEDSRETAAAPHQDITHHSSPQHQSASDQGAPASEPSKREGNAA